MPGDPAPPTDDDLDKTATVADDEALFQRGSNFFAPAGLDLGGAAPETIALAVVTEIQAVFAGGSKRSSSAREVPIQAPETAPLIAAL